MSRLAKTVRLLLVLAMVLTLVAAMACGDDEEATPTPAPTATPEPTPAAPLKIGQLNSFTGDLSDFGAAHRDSAQLAIDHINQAGGVQTLTT